MSTVFFQDQSELDELILTPFPLNGGTGNFVIQHLNCIFNIGLTPSFSLEGCLCSALSEEHQFKIRNRSDYSFLAASYVLWSSSIEGNCKSSSIAQHLKSNIQRRSGHQLLRQFAFGMKQLTGKTNEPPKIGNNNVSANVDAIKTLTMTMVDKEYKQTP